MGPDKDRLCTYNCVYFLTHQFKHVFWVLKQTVSLRRFFEYPQNIFWLRNKKVNFPVDTLIWRPACCLVAVSVLFLSLLVSWVCLWSVIVAFSGHT